MRNRNKTKIKINIDKDYNELAQAMSNDLHIERMKDNDIIIDSTKIKLTCNIFDNEKKQK